MEDNQLVQVPFNDQQVFAIQKGSSIFVPIKPICENIGLDWEAQRQRINRDTALSKGACMMQAPSKGGLQDTVCLPIEYLNGWLFGIEDKKLSPEIQKKVLVYKEECFQVLFGYFFKGFAINQKAVEENPEILDRLSNEIRRIRLEHKALYRKMTDAMSLTCSDYAQRSQKEKSQYFAKIQDMIHFAVSGKVAAQLVYENVDASKPLGGMTSYAKTVAELSYDDLKIGRNYLSKKSFRQFEILYDVLFAFVEMKALNGEEMTLEKWEHQLREVIINLGLNPFPDYKGANRQMADEKAKEEWKKFQPIKRKILDEQKERIKQLRAAQKDEPEIDIEEVSTTKENFLDKVKRALRFSQEGQQTEDELGF